MATSTCGLVVRYSNVEFPRFRTGSLHLVAVGGINFVEYFDIRQSFPDGVRHELPNRFGVKSGHRPNRSLYGEKSSSGYCDVLCPLAYVEYSSGAKK